ncbi:unnamed protein product [Rotaria magnacalcarata]|uniref:Uncharacterized protein n=1 Tax=Rotaria magnacalcarata TaxID=392030 RepID=A0A815AEM6_9BILA|nr:unnamed protein product [Rotaria magnacalcarata]CAF1366336.1 unnamed protein product [Rotaria magnacalcarata]CAF1989599.1 unnamed protein product [Rotaria magnacalcarata]CAF3789801.1 unnamed protein product [Rotaria magnacalcarata]CAF3817104.1 unnamed protein product [Rotaria magnacalcarata]
MLPSNDQPESFEMPKNLEVFSLIWCDESQDRLYENRQTQEKLRDLINFHKKFTNVQKCESYLHHETTVEDKIILISSGTFGHVLLPKIHDMPQVKTIYIYCLHQTNHEQWIMNFSKVMRFCVQSMGHENMIFRAWGVWVKGIQVNAGALFSQIVNDHKEEEQLDKTTISMSFFNAEEKSHKNLSKENGDFIWLQLFIETLLRMRSVDIETSLDEYVTMIKLQYKENVEQLKNIEEFHQSYEPDHCLWWYSKQVFLYSVLNKALRLGDIDTLYAFRFFIRDIYQELQENKQFDQLILDLYRGQGLSMDELTQIQVSIGQYVSMNSFLSTNGKRQVALLFAQSIGTNNSTLKPVLFHIKVNTQLPDTKPFADVRLFSHFGEAESEILFMLGSVFKINGVRYENDEQVYIIDMELCSEQDNELKDLYDRMKNDLGDETNIKVLGNVLKDMGLHDKALQCYHNLLKQLKPNDPAIQSCYYGMGQVMQLKGIAYHYGKSHDYTRALYHYNKALELHLEIQGPEYLPITYIYNNLATLYRALEDYDKSLEYHFKCLDLKRKLFKTEQDWRIASTYNNIGAVCHYKTDFHLALEYYKKGLKIRLKTLPENHQDVAISYYNVGEVYHSLDEYQLALENSQKAYDMYLKIFGENYPLVTDLKETLHVLQEQVSTTNECVIPSEDSS